MRQRQQGFCLTQGEKRNYNGETRNTSNGKRDRNLNYIKNLPLAL